MIHLFHGEEEFGKSEAVAALKRSISDDLSLIDINVTALDGRTVTTDELQHHCDVPPFLGEYRLVIVSDLLARLGGSKSKQGEVTAAAAGFEEWLLRYLPGVAETTHLVLAEGKSVSSRHRVLVLVAGLGNLGDVRAFAAPTLKGGELAQWVEQRARSKGTRLETGVASDLATFVGPNLRLLDSELDKLALYAAGRPVAKTDVRLLVPYAQEANIFDMVDALGNRQTAQALRLLAQLYNEGAHPLYLLTMIVRQFRILLQTKELVGQGLNKDAVAQRLGLHTFPAGKAVVQAQRYSPQQLQSIFDRLLDTDVAIKTGRMEASLALYLLVVELARS